LSSSRLTIPGFSPTISSPSSNSSYNDGDILFPDLEHDMDSGPATTPTREDLPISLLQLLSNTLVLYQTTPYLPVSALLALGATSKSYRSLVHDTPHVFRHLDLRKVRAAQFEIAAIDHGGEVWRNVQLDENVTEDECVALHNT